MDIFGVLAILDYILGSCLCILGSLLKVKEQNGNIFRGLLIFNLFLFLVCVISLIFFRGEQ